MKKVQVLHLELNLNGEDLDASEIFGMTVEDMNAAGITTSSSSLGLQILIDQSKSIITTKQKLRHTEDKEQILKQELLKS